MPYELVQKPSFIEDLISLPQSVQKKVSGKENPALYSRYDAVTIHEAQDLTPAGLSICVELCSSPTGLYLTADANQSIYNRGFTWSRVHEALKFRGRAAGNLQRLRSVMWNLRTHGKKRSAPGEARLEEPLGANAFKCSQIVLVCSVRPNQYCSFQ